MYSTLWPTSQNQRKEQDFCEVPIFLRHETEHPKPEARGFFRERICVRPSPPDTVGNARDGILQQGTGCLKVQHGFSTVFFGTRADALAYCKGRFYDANGQAV